MTRLPRLVAYALLFVLTGLSGRSRQSQSSTPGLMSLLLTTEASASGGYFSGSKYTGCSEAVKGVKEQADEHEGLLAEKDAEISELKGQIGALTARLEWTEVMIMQISGNSLRRLTK